MREIKSIEQILSVSAIDMLNELLAKCDVSIDSIKLCSNRMFVVDSILLHLFGYLEKKLQDYYLFYAMLDPNQRYDYYIAGHKIEFDFSKVLDIYRISFKLDKTDKKANIKLVNFIKPKFNDFKRCIKETIGNFSICEDVKYLYDSFKCIVFDDKDDDGIYKCLGELFRIAYAYRNNIAHNLDCEYRNCTCDFDILKGETINCNVFSYFFIIIIIDYIINECYRKVLISNLLLF